MSDTDINNSRKNHWLNNEVIGGKEEGRKEDMKKKTRNRDKVQS